jgi:hypothetical protein
MYTWVESLCTRDERPIVRRWRRGCRRRTACRGPPLGDEVDDAERPMLGTLRPQAPNELVGLGPMLRKGGGRLPEDCGVGREEDASGWRLLAAARILAGGPTGT